VAGRVIVVVVDVDVVDVVDVVPEGREANVKSSGAACATALQYAGGDARVVLRRPKPPSRMGNVRDNCASDERGVGKRSILTAVVVTQLSKYSAVGARMSGRIVRVR
jgi:hypothetical protein